MVQKEGSATQSALVVFQICCLVFTIDINTRVILIDMKILLRLVPAYVVAAVATVVLPGSILALSGYVLALGILIHPLVLA
jgi:hypothetical protein